MSLNIIKNIPVEKSKKFVEMIYQNFIDLSDYPELKHNREELTRLVSSENAKIALIIVENKIAAYLVGETIDLVDGRRVFYVSYIFTAKKFRKQGFGSQLMEYVEELSKKFNYDGVLLTCDTENQNVYDFYLIRGYMPDLVLRKYNQHDVMFKRI